LIINNAISSKWGFPTPCPAGCPCDCFDARREECQCAIPPRMRENFPAYFLVDYIRVYQDLEDANQTIGCSTKRYPTRRYIQAHSQAYAEAAVGASTVPLQPIARGGQSCLGVTASLNSASANIGDLECGKGYCNQHQRCVCDEGYTGPDCKAYVAYNDVDLDPDLDVIALSRFVVPTSLVILSISLIIGYFIAVAYKYKYNQTIRGSWRMLSRPVYSMDSLAQAAMNVFARSNSNGNSRMRGSSYRYEPVVEMESYQRNSLRINETNPLHSPKSEAYQGSA
jgi:hypothetical protein